MYYYYLLFIVIKAINSENIKLNVKRCELIINRVAIPIHASQCGKGIQVIAINKCI